MEGMMSQDTVKVTVLLPDSLAQEAERDGLLTSAGLEALLREALARRRVKRLFETTDRLAALPGSPPTESEIEEEIQTARKARRAANARGS
jgi:hypothetical protein